MWIADFWLKDFPPGILSDDEIFRRMTREISVGWRDIRFDLILCRKRDEYS